jgi:hypothetical protein
MIRTALMRHPTHQVPSCSSRRTMDAPSTMAFILPNATSLGRYFIPQSVHTMMFRGSVKGSARRMRRATSAGDSTCISDRSITPSMTFFPAREESTEQSRLDCAVSIEI